MHNLKHACCLALLGVVACGSSTGSAPSDSEPGASAGAAVTGGTSGSGGSAAGSDGGISGAAAATGGRGATGGSASGSAGVAGTAGSAAASGAASGGSGASAGGGMGGDVGGTSGAGGTDAGAGGQGADSAIECTAVPPIFPTFDRTCEAPSDCTLVEHTTSCCGSALVMAVRAGEKAAFDAAELVCDDQYPLCDCVTQWVDVEDGTQIPFDKIGGIAAACQDGNCRAVYEAESFDCLDKRCGAGTYCAITTGGPAGSIPSASCPTTECTECDCLGVVGCECRTTDGHLEVTCNNP